MQIANGRIAKSYASEIDCPWCKMSKLRYDIEFELLTLEQKQIIDSSYLVKGICVHCLTVCDQLPKMDFVCAKRDQLTTYTQSDSEQEKKLFGHLFSSDGKFGDFYQRLINEGIKAGKRYCLSCVYKIWHGYLANHSFVLDELNKPKPEYELKKF